MSLPLRDFITEERPYRILTRSAPISPSAISAPLEKPRTASLLMHDEKAVHMQSRVVEFLTGFTHGAAPPSQGSRRKGRYPAS